MEVGIELGRLNIPETIHSSVAEGHPSTSSSLLKPSRLIGQNEEEFWTAGRREIPLYVGNPWDFYEQLLKLGSNTWMVLCDDRSTVRVIEGFDNIDESPSQYPHVEQGSPSFPILEIRHPNFVNIDEIYLCQGEVFAITEYIGPSIEDLLRRPIEFSEPEIAYVLSQVSQAVPLFYPANAVGFGRHTLYLVAEAGPSPYIYAKYSRLSKRSDQNQ
jgi:hypothetical protein